jgi:hypothetical protein
MSEIVRACRDCGEEYRPGILVCADCGGEVVERGIVAAAAPAPAQPEPQSDLVHTLFVSARALDVLPLCERLRELGVEHRLIEQAATPDGAPPRYGILVREPDAAQALAGIAELLAPDEEGARLRAIEEHFDREHGYKRCPACSTATPIGALECPECGLGLVGEESTEPDE